MIEALGKWIVTICVAIFFATAVQMILPDNSLKKYCNFVLGLIVFVVMISPIVNLFNKDITIDKLIEQTTKEVFNEESQSSTNYEEYRNGNIDSALKVFKNNLEQQCSKDLAKEFKGDEFSVAVDVGYDEENQTFVINAMEVGVNDGSIKRVEDVVIGGDKSVSANKQDEETGAYGLKVKDYISSNYGLSEELIYIYKAD
ncbi:stage III sporulation protein AF [Clostridium culturomicium]|uniref:stage III sporulation protein AF n=1 Tax=Clostridium culturomicium TaxID=1499683 RepID=UPI00058FE9B1|nr:stage III sporulation protein AF [Clostridium culturomicium]